MQIIKYLDSKIFNKKNIFEIDQSYKNFKLLVFDDLVKNLNVYHGTNYSKRYWQIIIEPWYTHFLRLFYIDGKLLKNY